MRTHKAWTILAAGWLAMGCAGQNLAQKSGSAEPAAVPPPAVPAQADAPAPGAGIDSSAPRADFEGGEESAEPAPAPLPAAPPATAAPESASRSSAGAAAKPRAEAKKSSRPLDVEQERPGLGTTWGETRSSRVSNSPFERASNNPFSVATVNYNDERGIAAMLRTSSFGDFRTEAAAVGNGMVTVRVTDGNGTPLPTFASGGRTLIEGEVGQRYVIELANTSSNRFEAVVTVDGLDVIDGRPGSFSKRGYLIQPFGSVQIDGFRQNMDEVAAFRFGSVRGSYAAQKGNDRNVGVIGVALFAERGAEPWTTREIGRRESADPFPGRFASPPIAR
ncbi:MAG TPA: hypothetical protein VGK73_39160 [Polyangiaceae bacterium]